MLQPCANGNRKHRLTHSPIQFTLGTQWINESATRQNVEACNPPTRPRIWNPLREIQPKSKSSALSADTFHRTSHNAPAASSNSNPDRGISKSGRYRFQTRFPCENHRCLKLTSRLKFKFSPENVARLNRFAIGEIKRTWDEPVHFRNGNWQRRNVGAHPVRFDEIGLFSVCSNLQSLLHRTGSADELIKCQID